MRVALLRVTAAATLLAATLCARAQVPYTVAWSDITPNTSVSNYTSIQIAFDNEGNTYTLERNNTLTTYSSIGPGWIVIITDPYGNEIDEFDGEVAAFPLPEMAVDPDTGAVFVGSIGIYTGFALDGEQADGNRFTDTLPIVIASGPLAIRIINGQVVVLADNWDYCLLTYSEDGQNTSENQFGFDNPLIMMGTIDPLGNGLVVSGNGFDEGPITVVCTNSAGNQTGSLSYEQWTPANTYYSGGGVTEDPEGNMYALIDVATYDPASNQWSSNYQVLGFKNGVNFEILNGIGTPNFFNSDRGAVTQLAVSDPNHIYAFGDGYLHFLNASGEQWKIPQDWQAAACPNDGSGSVLAAWYDSANKLMRFDKFGPDGSVQYTLNYPAASAAVLYGWEKTGGIDIEWSGKTAYITGNLTTDTSSSRMTMKLTEVGGPALQSLTAPISVLGGTSFSITATLNSPAQSQYRVAIRNPNQVSTLSNEINIFSGSTIGRATAYAAPVNTATPVTIEAVDPIGIVRTAKVTILPAVTNLSLTPTTVYAGNPVNGAVTIYGVAGSNGAAVNLSSDNSTVQLPASVTVAASQSKAQFAITTSLITSVVTAHISANYNGSTATQTLTLSPAVVGSITPLSPSTVGGTSAEFQVKFKGDLGAATQVTLTSSNPAVAAVPSSITIPQGGWTGYFNVKTFPVTTPTQVTITASSSGANASCQITVNP